MGWKAAFHTLSRPLPSQPVVKCQATVRDLKHRGPVFHHSAMCSSPDSLTQTNREVNIMTLGALPLSYSRLIFNYQEITLERIKIIAIQYVRTMGLLKFHFQQMQYELTVLY